MNEQVLNDQEQMMDVARKTRERVTEEIPHLQNLVRICGEEHPSAVVPLCGIMHSFARFTTSEDNEKLLHYVKELYASYAYAKKNKDSLERRHSKTILNNLQKHENQIATYRRKGVDVEYHMDFYPLMRQYMLLIVRGHKQSNEECEICESMLKLVGEISDRELQRNFATVAKCDELLS